MDFATLAGTSIIRVWLPMLAGLAGIVGLYQSGPGPHGVVRWIGLLLALFGLAGVIISRHTLGLSFSVAAKATALVTTGLYSRIRNPIYVSGIILFAGIFAMLQRIELLALFAVIIPLQVIRARREAAVLEAKFGEAYRDYRKQTWF